MAKGKKQGFFQIFGEYTQALFGAVILAVIIRGFIFEPFKIPSKSMVPTLLVGDHIFVARYKYGLRVPFTKYWLTEFDGPKRGDTVVFTFPEDEDVDFIKRVVGLPGDMVAMKGGVLSINGVEIHETDVSVAGVDTRNKRLLDIGSAHAADLPPQAEEFPNYRGYSGFQIQVESFHDKERHFIQRSRSLPVQSDFELTVPERSYFVLGDNRDQSMDSRFWGVVPRENLKGKAIFIWLSLDNDFGGVRWNRFGNKIF